MPRLTQIDPATAQGKAKDLLDSVQSKMGAVPNLTRVMANEPAVLNAYLANSAALSEGSFDPKTREAIALTVAGFNGCDYCSSAHGFISKNLKVEADEIVKRLNGTSSDPKLRAILTFAKRVLGTRGHVTGADLQAVRDAGLDDAGIAETVANVAANVFTNYLNDVAQTDIDFPVMRTGTAQAA